MKRLVIIAALLLTALLVLTACEMQGEQGEKGEQGVQGEKGEDGVTPILRINAVTNMWEVSYDNGKAWTSLNVAATGAQGEQGAQGLQGEQGIQGDTGAPGEKGDKGDKGDTGAPGTNGTDGKNGVDGQDGKDGKDGITPMLRINETSKLWEVSYDSGTSWRSLGVSSEAGEGAKGDKGDPGKDGVDGKDGKDGADGVGVERVETVNGEIIVTLTNGVTQNLGKFPVCTNAGGHTFSGWLVTVEAGCTADGYQQHYCTTCGYTETKCLPSSGHIDVITMPAEQPHCLTDGHTAYQYCRTCASRITEPEAIPNTSPSPGHHIYTNNGVNCTECGDSVIWELWENGYCDDGNSIIDAGDRFVLGWEDGAADYFDACGDYTLIVPVNIWVIGYSLPAVYPEMFAGYQVSDVVLQQNITTICSGAFRGCSMMEAIQMTNRVQLIEAEAFRGCINLKTIVFHGTVAEWHRMPKEAGWNLGTGNYTVYCSDGTASK